MKRIKRESTVTLTAEAVKKGDKSEDVVKVMSRDELIQYVFEIRLTQSKSKDTKSKDADIEVEVVDPFAQLMQLMMMDKQNQMIERKERADREEKEAKERKDREEKEAKEKVAKEEKEVKERKDREEKEAKDKKDRDEKEAKEKVDKEEKELKWRMELETQREAARLAAALDKQRAEDMFIKQSEFIAKSMARQSEVTREIEMARIEREGTDRRRRDEANNRWEVRLKNAKDALRNVMPFMPPVNEDIPGYFVLVEKTFADLKIAPDLHLTLINSFLTDDARRLLANFPVGHFRTFEEAKEVILRTYKLSAGKYKSMFSDAEKKSNETYAQFVNRLSIYLNYYLKSRDVKDDYQRLVNLLITDQLKSRVFKGVREQVRIAEKGKWMEAPALAEILDIYVSEREEYSTYSYGTSNYKSGNKFARGANATPSVQSDLAKNAALSSSSPSLDKSQSTWHNSASAGGNKNSPKRGNAVSERERNPSFHAACSFCKQREPKHSPLNCYQNPNGPKFRSTLKSNVRRVSAQFKQTHVTPGDEVLSSVDNFSVGFAKVSMCVNSPDFDLGEIFNEGLTASVSRCYTGDLLSPTVDGDLTDCIPSSCRALVNFGGGDIEVVVDSGTELTILSPSQIPTVPEFKPEFCGKVKLTGAFGQPVQADLVTLQCRLVSADIIYPYINIQVAVTDKLNGIGLLSLSDYNMLSRMTLTAVPGALYKNGRCVPNVVASQMGEEVVRDAVPDMGAVKPSSHTIAGHGNVVRNLTSTQVETHMVECSPQETPKLQTLPEGQISKVLFSAEGLVEGVGTGLSRASHPQLGSEVGEHGEAHAPNKVPAYEVAALSGHDVGVAEVLSCAAHAGKVEALPEARSDPAAGGSTGPEAWSASGIAVEQKSDESLSSCIKDVEKNKSLFFYKDDLLYRRLTHTHTRDDTVACLVLPSVCRIPVMKIAHELGHFAAKKTWLRLKKLFFWPNMRLEVKNYCDSCVACQKRRRVTVLDRVPIQSVPRPDTAFDTLSIDCAGPVEPPSARGHHYIMVVVDHCTRWADAVPLKSLTAKETCAALNTVFQRVGIPRVIISDNGSNFVSNLNKVFFSNFGIELRNSTPLHPQGNSLAERLVQNVKKMLHHAINSDEPRAWDLKLPSLMWALRTVPNETTGYTPYEMVYGKVGRGPLEVLRDSWGGADVTHLPLNKSSSEYLTLLKSNLKLFNEYAEANCHEAQRTYVEQYNVRSRPKSFSVGDSVLVLLPDSTNKLLSSWQGPGVIHFKLSENSYTVAMPNGSIRHLHANMLREFHVSVHGVGVIFQDDSEKFGEVEWCETGDGGDNPTFTGLTRQKLDGINLDHLQSKQRDELKDLLWQFRQVFDDKPGICKSATHSIKLEPGFKPRFQRPYRIPEKLKAEVDRQIDELLKDGKIVPSRSSFAHPIVLVFKPDASIRICVDYRCVNSGTVVDKYPMARADDILRKMAPSTYITTLDCTAGYYQLRMTPESVPLTAFTTHRGIFEFKVMPFGLRCAGQSYQRAIDQMLAPHQEYAAGYIDDVSVFSGDWVTHLIHVQYVLQEFKDHGMTLKLKKCAFARPKVQFLGHMVGSGKISVVQSKVDAIRLLPIPTTKKLLRSFLGMCGYYRPFLQDFASVAAPLTDLTKGGKSGRVVFGERELQAFEDLKGLLCRSVELSTPVYDRPFRIQTDASEYAVGACLNQVDVAGNERPLAFASEKLSETQRRWSVLEREAYAVVYAVKQFDHIIFGSEVHVFTDHDPLAYMINNSPKCVKLTRWALHLSRYDLRVFHKAGVTNVNADCLSRLIA